MIEEWRTIVGYEGLYEVSSYGRVRSLDRYDERNHLLKGRILKLSSNTVGYLIVGLCSNGKRKSFLVHRLVAQAFILNPDNLPQVNHRDEDKTNNRVENLEMCNAKYNSNYGSRKDRVRNSKIKNGYWSGLSKKEYNKKLYQEKKKKICEQKREYYRENREKISEQKREYMKKYYREHKDKMNDYQKEYRRKRKEQIQNNV